jgi:hypothetical protein
MRRLASDGEIASVRAPAAMLPACAMLTNVWSCC